MTTEAVMTEVFHLAIRDFHRIGPAWDFFDSDIVTLAPLSDADLPEIHKRTVFSYLATSA